MLISVDFQLPEKRDSGAGVFSESCKIRKKTSFARGLFLIIAVSIVLVVKGELTSETINYDTKIMYQFEPQV